MKKAFVISIAYGIAVAVFGYYWLRGALLIVRDRWRGALLIVRDRWRGA